MTNYFCLVQIVNYLWISFGVLNYKSAIHFTEETLIWSLTIKWTHAHWNTHRLFTEISKWNVSTEMRCNLKQQETFKSNIPLLELNISAAHTYTIFIFCQEISVKYSKSEFTSHILSLERDIDRVSEQSLLLFAMSIIQFSGLATVVKRFILTIKEKMYLVWYGAL